ncbi:MAG: hypothetical protein ACRD1C_11360 [Terriglobales bacterium]
MRAVAGPPFLTDDPDVVDFHHYELFLIPFTMVEAGGDYGVQAPGVELNMGVLVPNLQLHAVVTGAENLPRGGVNTAGIGDTELGVEYRFIQEGKHRPMVATYPMVEAATGNPELGLGNGATYYHLPVWAQKSFGSWTTYGGADYTINHAPGAKNNLSLGWELQKQITKTLWLGGEVFHQGQDLTTDHSATFADLGGGLALNKSQSWTLLFSGGHTFLGDQRAEGYLSFVYAF